MPEESAQLERVVQTLTEQRLIADVGPPIKSGKEATVFRCRGPSSTGTYDFALKLFRPLDQRGFRNDAIYWEGSAALRRADGETREARALRKGSRFGRRFAAKTWVEHEWEVLSRLWQHGLAVPRPVHLTDDAILMERFTTSGGDPAPSLHGIPMPRDVATVLFESLQRDVEDMLQLDLVHGDLSPYNILWNGEEYRIIDFPQTVDARFNPNARRLLLRDLTVLADFFNACGVVTNARVLGEEMWTRFQQV